MSELFANVPSHIWPEEITVEPSRLSIGLWGESEGDIAAAYCADTFPKIKTFVHEGHLFTNTGACHSGQRESVGGYPLILATDYHGPEPRPYSYEGKTVRYHGRNYRLGPKVTFVCRERTSQEWVDLLRRQYAYGGYCASGKTYAQVLEFFAGQRSISAGERAAIEAEAARTDLPHTQEEMLASFTTRIESRPVPQLELMFE